MTRLRRRPLRTPEPHSSPSHQASGRNILEPWQEIRPLLPDPA